MPSGIQVRFWGRLGAHLEVPTLRKHQKHYCFSPFSKSQNFAHRSSFWTTLAAFWCHLLQKAPNLGPQWTRLWPGNASFWSPETTLALHAPKSPPRVPKSPGNGSKCLQKELKKRTKHLCHKRITGYACMLSTVTLLLSMPASRILVSELLANYLARRNARSA